MKVTNVNNRSIYRIGILGGTFDPPHLGHLGVGQSVLDFGLVDKVLFIPCLKHAFGKKPEKFEHRLNMCNLLVDGHDNMEVCDIEQNIKHPGRTFFLIKALVEKIPSAEFRLVVGSDIYFEKDKWYNFNLLKEMAPFIYVTRAGEKEIPVSTLPAPVEISSSEIRKIIVNKNKVNKKEDANLVPKAIIDYIYKNKLYGAKHG